MSQFVLVQVGDTVYDKIQGIKGVVVETDNTTTKVKPDSPADEEFILCKTHNLVTITKTKKKTDNKSDGNKFYKLVKEFHTAFNHPVANSPTPLTLERMTYRKIWEFEEGIEALFASSTNEDEFNQAVNKVVKGIEQARIKSLKEEFPKNDEEKLVAQADAITDGTYFLQGDMVELGLEPDRLFEIVQSANMSKLFIGENGKKYAKYRESDGKILKSPEFFEPEPLIKEEIKRQSNN